MRPVARLRALKTFPHGEKWHVLLLWYYVFEGVKKIEVRAFVSFSFKPKYTTQTSSGEEKFPGRKTRVIPHLKYVCNKWLLALHVYTELEEMFRADLRFIASLFIGLDKLPYNIWPLFFFVIKFYQTQKVYHKIYWIIF